MLGRVNRLQNKLDSISSKKFTKWKKKSGLTISSDHLDSFETQRVCFYKDLLQANNMYNYSQINIPLYEIHEMLVMRKGL